MSAQCILGGLVVYPSYGQADADSPGAVHDQVGTGFVVRRSADGPAAYPPYDETDDQVDTGPAVYPPYRQSDGQVGTGFVARRPPNDPDAYPPYRQADDQVGTGFVVKLSPDGPAGYPPYGQAETGPVGFGFIVKRSSAYPPYRQAETDGPAAYPQYRQANADEPVAANVARRDAPVAGFVVSACPLGADSNCPPLAVANS